MSSGSAVDPVDSLLLVAAKKVDQSDEFNEDDRANEMFLREFSGLTGLVVTKNKNILSREWTCVVYNTKSRKFVVGIRV